MTFFISPATVVWGFRTGLSNHVRRQGLLRYMLWGLPTSGKTFVIGDEVVHVLVVNVVVGDIKRPASMLSYP